jgi:hypothetical protein
MLLQNVAAGRGWRCIVGLNRYVHGCRGWDGRGPGRPWAATEARRADYLQDGYASYSPHASHSAA